MDGRRVDVPWRIEGHPPTLRFELHAVRFFRTLQQRNAFPRRDLQSAQEVTALFANDDEASVTSPLIELAVFADFARSPTRRLHDVTIAGAVGAARVDLRDRVCG